MKHLKKVMALVIAMVMVLSMSLTVFASAPVPAINDNEITETGPFDIKVADGDTHTYMVYQIFTGTPYSDSETDETGLLNLKYGTAAKLPTGKSVGDAVSSEDMKKLKDIIEQGATPTQDQYDIENMYPFFNSSATGVEISAGHPYDDAPTGYYLIVDTTTTTNEDDSKNLHVFSIVSVSEDDVTVAQKREKPTIEKKLKDINDSSDTAFATTFTEKSADHDIGDIIPFEITANAAANVEAYTKYHMTIHDDYCDALSAPIDNVLTLTFSDNMGGGTYYFNLSDGKLYSDKAGAVAKTEAELVKGYRYADDEADNVPQENNIFLVTPSDPDAVPYRVEVKSGTTKGTDDFAVEFIVWSSLDTRRAVGDPAEKVIEYIDPTANSYSVVATYEAELLDTAVIGNDGNKNDTYLTYSNNPNVDENGKPKEDIPEQGETPKDTVVVFTYKVDVDKIDQDYKDLTGAQFVLLKKYAALPDDVDATDVGDLDDLDTTAAAGDFFADGDGAYWKVVDKNGGVDSGSHFHWRGIDDGDYKIIETVVPDGYNKVSDVDFTVTATHRAVQDGETSTTGYLVTGLSGGSDFQANPNGGEFLFTKKGDTTKTHTMGADNDKEAMVVTAIVNQSGTELPETGGMGTTIFYVLGAVLVIGAGILLITRRRMRAN